MQLKLCSQQFFAVKKVLKISLPIIVGPLLFPKRYECFLAALHIKGQINFLYDCSKFGFLFLKYRSELELPLQLKPEQELPLFSRLRLHAQPWTCLTMRPNSWTAVKLAAFIFNIHDKSLPRICEISNKFLGWKSEKHLADCQITSNTKKKTIKIACAKIVYST